MIFDNMNCENVRKAGKTKRFAALIICAAVILCTVSLSVVRSAAAENTAGVPAVRDMSTPYNWYCRHMENGGIPPIDPQMKFIFDHGGYYLDRNACEEGAGKKVIYLTFDAGYENGNVEKILDVMKEKQVTGAFFVLENLVKTEPDLIKRMAAEGHLVCNHTASHRDMTTVSDRNEFAAELSSLENTVKEETGLECAKYFRPPEGRFNENDLIWANELGYKTIFWSFAYVDWDNERQMSCDDAVNKVMKGTHNGEIILLHPTSSTNARILGTLIDKWREDGYTFGTLDDLTKK